MAGKTVSQYGSQHNMAVNTVLEYGSQHNMTVKKTVKNEIQRCNKYLIRRNVAEQKAKTEKGIQ